MSIFKSNIMEVESMKNSKFIVLLALSLAILAIGIFGIANVWFFKSTVGLEIIEIIMGIGGLIVALRNS